MTVTPALNQYGTNTITVTVTDGDGATASKTFTLVVTPVNDPPSVTLTTAGDEFHRKLDGHSGR